jgi:hypothetical protein
LVLGALVSAWRLAMPGAGPGFGLIRQTDAAHLLMNASMALMFSPWYGLAANAAVIVLYVFMAAAIIVLGALDLRRKGQGRDARIATYAYHFIVTAGMLYIILRMSIPIPDQMPGMAMPGMAMPGMAMPPVPAQRGLLADLIGLAFFADAMVTAAVVLFFPAQAAQFTALGGEAATGTTNLRLGALPHVIMDIGMVAMVVMMA